MDTETKNFFRMAFLFLVLIVVWCCASYGNTCVAEAESILSGNPIVNEDLAWWNIVRVCRWTMRPFADLFTTIRENLSTIHTAEEIAGYKIR